MKGGIVASIGALMGLIVLLQTSEVSGQRQLWSTGGYHWGWHNNAYDNWGRNNHWNNWNSNHGGNQNNNHWGNQNSNQWGNQNNNQWQPNPTTTTQWTTPTTTTVSMTTTIQPSERPSERPTTVPPSERPSERPTTVPPSERPSERPTTVSPSERPTEQPTTMVPSDRPSDRPTTTASTTTTTTTTNGTTVTAPPPGEPGCPDVPTVWDLIEEQEGGNQTLNLISAVDPSLANMLSNPEVELQIFLAEADAWQEFADEMNKTVMELIEDGVIDDEVLRYHVINGTLEGLKEGIRTNLKSLQGSELILLLENGTYYINSAEFEPGCTAGNGRLYQLKDDLLFPPTGNLVEVAKNQTDPSLQILVNLVEEAGLAGQVSQLSNITVIAPDDEAFEQVPVDSLPAEELRRTLAQHILKGVIYAGTIMDGDVFETLAGGKIVSSIDADGNLSFNGSKVLVPDVQATNGNCFIVDAVIMAQEAVQSAEISASVQAESSSESGGQMTIVYIFIGAAAIVLAGVAAIFVSRKRRGLQKEPSTPVSSDNLVYNEHNSI